MPRLLVLASDTSRTGYWLTLAGIFEAAREMQVELGIHMIPATAPERMQMLATALQSRVDGAVVLEFDWPGVAILDDLPVDLPIAVAGGDPSVLHTPTDPPRAWIDDHGGAKLATQHLVDLGHRRIAYVGVPPAGHPDPREAGWRSVLTANGLPIAPIAATGWSVETGIRAARRLVDSGASAVLCGNDDLALGVMAGLARAGRRVPEDVSVVGMDDHPHALSAVPALTTVRLDFERLGRVATQLALGVHPAVTENGHIEIPARLRVRATTCERREA